MAELPGLPLACGVSRTLQLQSRLPGDSTPGNNLRGAVVSKVKRRPPLRWALMVPWVCLLHQVPLPVQGWSTCSGTTALPMAMTQPCCRPWARLVSHRAALRISWTESPCAYAPQLAVLAAVMSCLVHAESRSRSGSCCTAG